MHPSLSRGQGSLEYLLLIAGGILVAGIILVIALNTTPQGGDIVDDNLCAYGVLIQGGSCSPYLNALTVSLDSTSAGTAQFTFTWAGTQYPPARGNGAAGIVGGSDLFVPPRSVIDFSTVNAWAAVVQNGAPVDFFPLFAPTNGAGQSGILQNHTLKSFARSQFESGGSDRLQFAFWLDTEEQALAPYSDPARIPYPLDTEAPDSIGSVSAVSTAPGTIQVSFTEPHDHYLGAPIDLPYMEYTAAYSTSASFTIPDAILGGQFSSEDADTPGAPFILDITGVPPGTYYVAVQACDARDDRTVMVSNCTLASFYAGTVTVG